jgi:hypothetical protein
MARPHRLGRSLSGNCSRFAVMRGAVLRGALHLATGGKLPDWRSRADLRGYGRTPVRFWCPESGFWCAERGKKRYHLSVVRISKLLKTWLGGKVLAWNDLSVSPASESGEWQGDGEAREWQAARQAAEEREWQAARQAAEEREWQAARQAAEEREWRALIAGAHQKSAAAPAVVVTRKAPVPSRVVESDEEEWSTLLARAKTAVVVRPAPKAAARDRWQTVFGKPRPGTGASAH